MSKSKADIFSTQLNDLAGKAKALAHPARLAILDQLARNETCICNDLVLSMPLAQATVSQHLSTLKAAGLIEGTTDGPRVCYCINRESLNAFKELFDEWFTGVTTCSECSTEAC